MENKLNLTVQNTGEKINLEVKEIFNAGYAGVNQLKVQEHIDELAKLGVPTPKSTPTLYPIANNLLSTTSVVQSQHEETSGEIEYVLIWANDELYLTVGSDHTDRKLETFDVAMSKQAYPNIISPEVWRFTDIKNHWDHLKFSCWIVSDNGERELYQEGNITDLLSPDKWKENFEKLDVEKNGNVFFSATINTLTKSLTFGDSYELQIEDPVLGRKISHQYRVEKLAKAID